MEERIRIEIMLSDGYKPYRIAQRIGRSDTTISREITNNWDPSGAYIWRAAHEKYLQRKSKENSLRTRITSEIEDYILTKLKEHWSPEQIAGRYTQETGEKLCKGTVYSFLRTSHPELVKKFFRRKGKKYRNRKAESEKYQIADRRMIDNRPQCIEERNTIGHWEWDTIVGKGHKGAIVTNVDRKSWYLLAAPVQRKTADAIFQATTVLFDDIPKIKKRSMTYDNWREFADHKLIEYSTGMVVFFAHPYHSWERWTNENTNGLLREFYPKGTDLTNVDPKELDYYVQIINNRPRKRLGYKTSREVFFEL